MESLQAGQPPSLMSHTWPVAYPRPQLLVHWVHSHWRCLHVDVPQLQVHVVATENVAPIPAELDVRNAADDLAEERLAALQGRAVTQAPQVPGTGSAWSSPCGWSSGCRCCCCTVRARCLWLAPLAALQTGPDGWL